MRANAFDRVDWLAASAIVVLAFVLRYLGIRLGLPYYHHWDEGWVTDNTAHMLQTSAWMPQTYQYGAPPSTIAALVILALRALHPERVFDTTDGVLLRVIGRDVTAIISSTGAFAIYVAARFATLGDRWARPRAIYAALAYAAGAELVTHGRYAATDANLVALSAWTLAFGALYVRGGRTRWAIATVTFAALAVAFKLTATLTLLVPIVLLALKAGTWRQRALRFAWAIPLAAFVFYALNPHFLLHASLAVRDIRLRVNQTVDGGVPELLLRWPGPEHLAGEAHALLFQLFHRWPWAAGIAGALSVSGLVLAWRQRSVIVVLGTTQAALLLLGFAFTSRAFLFRNYLGAAPILCIGIGFSMAWLHAEASRVRLATSARALLAAAFIGLFVVVSIVQAARAQTLSVDARTRALDWIAARVSKTTTVACTNTVIADVMGIRQDLRPTRDRSHLVFTPDVTSADDAARRHPDYVLVASYPDVFGHAGDLWPFREVPGYHAVAYFECNPYEHNFAITPMWGGRFNALVLARDR